MEQIETINTINVGNLTKYLTQIQYYRILTKEEETQLFMAYSENHDLSAVRKLILHNLRFVVTCVTKFKGYGIPREDLIQEGNIGLMQAIQKFDYSRGTKLITYAVYYINQNITDFIMKNVKMLNLVKSKHQRKLFYNMSKYNKVTKSYSDSELHTISNELKVPIKTIKEMEYRKNGTSIPYHTMEDYDEDNTIDAKVVHNAVADTSLEPSHIYELENSNVEKSNMINHIKTILNTLNERERDIVRRRFLVEKKATLSTLSSEYNISMERIRQIEKIALNKIRTKLQLK